MRISWAGLGLTVAAMTISVAQGSAGEFVGTDPYGRAVYARDTQFPLLPSRVSGPYYRKTIGQFGGPTVAGPLYYAEPAPPVPGFYRPDPLVRAGAVLAFDQNAALAAADSRGPATMRPDRPAPFSGEWYRDCEARYRSFDRETGTYQPAKGPRRLCR